MTAGPLGKLQLMVSMANKDGGKQQALSTKETGASTISLVLEPAPAHFRITDPNQPTTALFVDQLLTTQINRFLGDDV